MDEADSPVAAVRQRIEDLAVEQKCAMHAAACRQRLAERLDALLEMVERVAAAALAEILDLLAERLHLRRELADRVVRGDVGRHVAQRGDRVLELLQRSRILLRDDQVDLVREAGDGVVEPDQAFRRRQPAQRVAHLGEPVLETGDGVMVGAGLAAFGDALGQALDLLFDRIDGAARHRLPRL